MQKKRESILRKGTKPQWMTRCRVSASQVRIYYQHDLLLHFGTYILTLSTCVFYETYILFAILLKQLPPLSITHQPKQVL